MTESRPDINTVDRNLTTEEEGSISGQPPEVTPPNSELKQYFYLILAWWWVILLFVLIGAVGGIVWILVSEPVYRAACTYELARDLDMVDNDQKSQGDLPRLEQSIERQIFVLKSPVLKEKVSATLKSENPELIEGNPSPQITVQQKRDISGLVEIQVDSSNKDYALKFLEELIAAFRDHQEENIIRTKENSLDKLNKEKEELYQELKLARERLRNFEEKHNIRFAQTKARYEDEFLASLVQRKNSIRMEKTMLKSQFPFLEDANAATIRNVLALNIETHKQALADGVEPREELEAGDELPDISGEASEGAIRGSWSEKSDWKTQRSQLQDLKSEYEDKLEIFKKSHPKIMELEQKIADAERKLGLSADNTVDHLQNRHEALIIQEKSLDEATENWRRELDFSTRKQAEYALLQGSVEHYEKLYDKVHTFVLEKSLIDEDSVFNKAIQEPDLRSAPVKPDPPKIVAISLFLALAASGGTIFLGEQFKAGGLNVNGIEQNLQVPYLYGIPNWEQNSNFNKKNKDRILVTREKSDIPTEVYRTLRDSVEYAVGSETPVTLMITSNLRQTGKSLTSLNLAITYSWTGKKVLLVDGDMRCGVMYRDFGIERGEGLAELIKGTVHDWQQLVHDTEYDNLDILQAGKYSHDLPDLLSLHQLQRLFSEFQKHYDIILVDSAPVSLVVDPAIMARACGKTLLLVNYEKTSYNDIKHALHRLGNSNVIGFCLNNIKVPKNRYDYYRYRHYSHQHYYQPYTQ